jgi:high-affinity nickel-transport protein
MYPLGLLFGLGFDTEIGLLGISAEEASNGLPIWSILVFPALFTAGMSPVDSDDGALIVGAYGWAFTNPVRKLYNLTITGVSAAIAVAVGGIEALGLIADRLGLERDLSIAATHPGVLGCAAMGLFFASWIVSLVIYRAIGYHNPVLDNP